MVSAVCELSCASIGVTKPGATSAVTANAAHRNTTAKLRSMAVSRPRLMLAYARHHENVSSRISCGNFGNKNTTPQPTERRVHDVHSDLAYATVACGCIYNVVMW